MKTTVNIVNAFTKNGIGGNPAAVVLNADHLSNSQKKTIASKTGLSETAFVSSSATADFKLDFFTPIKQIAHCGHATIATFSYLKQIGMIGKKQTSSKETIDGRREIYFTGDEVFMQQIAPTISYLQDVDMDSAAASLGLKDLTRKPPIIVNTGNSFLIVEVEDETALAAIEPNHQVIVDISNKYGLIGYYIFCRTPLASTDVTTRMFAPAYGIEEESATGMAAGPLACYLFAYAEKKEQYSIEQGCFMNPASPSLITVNLMVEDGKITTVFAGGKATLIKQSTIEI